MALLLKPVVFFGGKGGVGKTTVAAAAAIASADAGRRTLLVSTDPAHSTADILGTALGPEPTPVTARLDAIEIDPAEAADRHIAEVKARIREAASPRMLKEIEREVDVARSSPGAEEAAVFDRFADLMSRAGDPYDRVIFDTAPTGHTLRLLALPELMEGWIEGLVARRRKVASLGTMWRNVAGAAAGGKRDVADPVLDALERRQVRFRRAREVVTDSERTTFVFVVTPERLPILETDRAIGTLRKYRIPVGGVVLNRLLPDDADGAFLTGRRQREGEYLREIDRRFGDLVRAHLMLRDHDPLGPADLRRLASELGAEM